MGIELRILILEDVPTDAELVERTLRGAEIEFTSRRADNRDDFLKQLEDFSPDLILSDYSMPRFTGLEALELVKERYPAIPLIIVTGSMNEETAVECMNRGAADYLIKENLARLGPAVERALENKRIRGGKKRAEALILRSARQWRTSFDSISDTVCLLDLQGTVQRCNRTFRDLVDKPFQEIIGRSCNEVLCKSSEPIEDCPLIRMRDSGRREEKELSLNDRWYHVTVDPVLDEKGNLTGAVHVMSDITERKQAEEKIRRSEESLAEAQRIAHLGNWDWNIVHNNLHWSDEEYRIFKLKPQEFEPGYKAFLDFVHPDDRELVTKAVDEALHENKPYSIDHRIVHPDGTECIVHEQAEIIFDDAGQPIRMFGTTQDITDLKRAEEEIRISQEALAKERDLLNSLLDNIPDHIYHKDTESKFIRINKTTSDLLGLSDPKQAVGKTDFDFFTEEHSRQAFEDEQELIKSGKAIMAKEEKETWPDREDTWASTTKVPLRNPEGDIIGIIGISRDITEHKKLEEQFRQSQKMEAVGRLAGGVAHDFNNMMTVVIGYSEFLLSKLKKEDAEYTSVAEIMNAGKRAASLTRQLLAFSRKQVLQPHVVNLNALITDLGKMLKRLIGEDIDLQVDLDSKLGAVRADPSQIDQITMNLAVNARDAMPRGGKITIETADVELDDEYCRLHMEVQPGPYVMLAVSDTGIGMDKETQSQIFEPFFSTKEEGKGTGLGLSTVYGIVKQSGGNIWVYTEPGQGTTFKIYFPRIEEATEAMKQEEASDKSFRSSETILLVEDEEMVRDLAYKVLAEMGYIVLAASNGEEAIQICERHKGPIHLMLTDVVMPKMSGRELAEASVRLYPEMKVIYMSGYTDNSVTRNGMLEPGVNFVQKPFTLLSLTKKVREVLDASESKKG